MVAQKRGRYTGKRTIVNPAKRTKRPWKNEYYLKAYLLAKDGISNHGIAKALGLNTGMFACKVKEDESLIYCLEEGRKDLSEGGQAVFRDYVFDRLSPELKEVWNRINEFDNLPDGILKMETLLQEKGIRARQNLFLYALANYNFDASRACKAVNISATTYERWCLDTEFQALVNEMQWHKANLYESSLVRLVQAGDSSAILFANKTFNRTRGYADTKTFEGKITHEHNHRVVSIGDLGLPLDIQMLILNAIRAKQGPSAGQKLLTYEEGFGNVPLPSQKMPQVADSLPQTPGHTTMPVGGPDEDGQVPANMEQNLVKECLDMLEDAKPRTFESIHNR